MNTRQFNEQLLSFLDASPTPFHAVATMGEQLQDAGFSELQESDSWTLAAKGRYFVTRNDSSIIAFTTGKNLKKLPEIGFRMVGAHTDSPCLRLKPNADMPGRAYYQLGVEVYGGVLLNPWFDRDLSLAGRVNYRTGKDELRSTLIDFKRPIASIPSLAIHLDREANDKRSINKQKHLPPLLALLAKDQSLEDILRKEIQRANKAAKIQGGTVQQVLAHELSFYDVQPASMLGLNDEFIAAARLDNLLSCFTGMQSLLAAKGDLPMMLICNDHEEVGSTSACGANGPMLADLLARLLPDNEDRVRAAQSSLLVSADNAHAVHPNYADKHDQNHGPVLNAGPVIKTNANQRYATNSDTSALFTHIAAQSRQAVQQFVVRSDMGCGSTIGPITASSVGVRTIDVGVPTFGMHSIRETAGANDAFALHKILQQFYSTASLTVA